MRRFNLREQWTNGSARQRPRIVDIAQARMQTSVYPSLRNVQCSWDDGVLTLRGEVPRYYLKQLAFSLVSDLQESCDINNAVNVHTG
jgi:hypothetical protein